MKPHFMRLFVVACLFVLLAATFSSAVAQDSPTQSPIVPRGRTAEKDDFDPARVSVVHTRDAEGKPVDRYYAPEATGRMVEVEGETMITGGPNGMRTVTVPPGTMAARQESAFDAPAATDGATVTGAQPWITVMCKFADVAAEPQNLAYFTNQYSATYPGLNHYFREASYNSMNLNGSTAKGWFTLPNDRSYYVDDGNDSVYYGDLYYDCINAADTTVNFGSYKGITLVFNEDIIWSSSGEWCNEFDGVDACRQITWIEPEAYDNNGIAYYMAEAYRMPHAYAWDWWNNPWDLTSDRWSYCGLSTHLTYGCLPQHVNGGSRAFQGWTPASRVITIGNSASTTVTLDRATQPGGNTNKLLIKVPILGYANHYFVVESRQKVGYDVKLPGQGVIMHLFDDYTWNGYARLIDGDDDEDPADPEAIWLPGETYDTGYGSTIQVLQATANGGYKVKVTTSGQTYDWWEQNDTRQTASGFWDINFGDDEYIYVNELTTDLFGTATSGDVDFFAFNALDADYIGIDVLAQRIGSPLDAKVDLYNAAGTLLASNIDYMGEKDPYLEYQLPSAGTYYVRVMGETPTGGPTYLYDLEIRRATPPDSYESNDEPGQAASITYGDYFNATLPYGRETDIDYYQFQGQAGDLIGIRTRASFHTLLSLFAPNGDLLDSIHCYTSCYIGEEYILRRLEQNGTYRILVEFAHGGEWPAGGSYSLVVDKPIFVSSSVSGNVQGIPFTPSDVLLNWPNANHWQMFFDGSDVGITKNVNSVAITRWGSMALGFAADQAITNLYDLDWNYLGKTTVEAQDLVWFSAYQLGDVTSGDFLWLLDGSDVGLTLASEKIDAVSFDSNWRLLVSLFGAGGVPGVTTVRDEDVLVFLPGTFGSDSTGTWEMVLQGSTIPGITTAQDVVGLAEPYWDELYLSMESNYTNLGGLTCGATCIILKGAGAYSKIWDGRNESFNYKLDAIELPTMNNLNQPYP